MSKENKQVRVEENETPVRKRSWTRWILPVIALAVVVALGAILKDRLHEDVWAYFTDDEGLRVDAKAKKERMVLWEDPRQRVFGGVTDANATVGFHVFSERVEATFSADGAMMVLTRWAKDSDAKDEVSETGADLYLSTWDGRLWSRPKPMVALNTEANERGAAFSQDGRYLYFSSDRDGGAGGYDLYVARFADGEWMGVERLGGEINSANDETGPAASADDARLFFSSNRKTGGKAQDIHVARRKLAAPVSGEDNATQPPVASALPPIPEFTEAKPVSVLNSSADDIETALTGRGSHVFLASDRGHKGKVGFNLYLSRVVKGKMQAPQKVDVYIKRGNATDPAVRMEGFDLLFSADGDLEGGEELAAAKPKYRLYQSTTREVIGYTDLSELAQFKQLMSNIIWWILLAIASLIALIYLLEKWRDITNLYHKCLAGSAMVHLLLLLLLSYWLITQALGGREPKAPEVAVSVDNLAEEELAMESEQELAEVSRTTQLIVNKNVQEFREVEFNPAEAATAPVPVPQRTTDQSLVSNFRPSKANESKGQSTPETVNAPARDSAVLQELAPMELPGLEVAELEVGEVASAEPVEPVDPAKDDFKVNEETLQKVRTEKAEVDPGENRKVDVVSKSESAAASSKPALTTDTVDPLEGLEANDLPRPVKSDISRDSLSNNLPGENPVDSLAKGLELEVNPADPSEGDFKRNEGDLQRVRTSQGQTGAAGNQQADVQSNAKSIAASGQPAPTTDTGGDTINPVDGLEANIKSPKLEGVIDQPMLSMNLPGEDTIDRLSGGIKLELPKDNPDVKNLGQFVKKLRGKPSQEVIEQLGGSEATERAIRLGLDWFTANQEPDGRWEMGKFNSNSRYNTAGAGLALLCYYGWGIKHNDNTRHAQAQSKALDWLLKQQKPDGDLRGNTGGRMYCHGIAAIALCEAYGLTKDPKLKDPALRSIEFILKAQHKEGGGWRYNPGEKGDLSVTGWQYMAMHSARMADLEVPEQAFVLTRKFIDSVAGGKVGGRYGYTGKGNGPPAMTATGMFLRQLDLSPPTAPNMKESAAYLKANMLKANRVDFYYDYYATLSLYQHQGPIWKEWNDNLKEVYVALQQATGANKGSWEPKGQHVNTGGRVLATGLAVLSLEVYYRLLPMYGFGRDEDE